MRGPSEPPSAVSGALLEAESTFGVTVPMAVPLEVTLQCAGQFLKLPHAGFTLSDEGGATVEIDLVVRIDESG